MISNVDRSAKSPVIAAPIGNRRVSISVDRYYPVANIGVTIGF